MILTIKSAEHLEEQELNKLLKYLNSTKNWEYYIIVRLGVSTALRFSDLSRLRWEDVLNKDNILVKEVKTGKIREIPIHSELQLKLNFIYNQLEKPKPTNTIIGLTIRGVNKQIKILAYRAGIRGKRISTHTWRKTFGREVWRRNNHSDEALIKLSVLFNHSSTAITRTYFDITKEEVGSLYQLQDFFIY